MYYNLSMDGERIALLESKGIKAQEENWPKVDAEIEESSAENTK